MDEAKVIGVQLLEIYKVCLKCRSKLPHGDDDEFNTCARCGMLQSTDECNTVQMMIRSSSSTQNIILEAFGKCLQEIAGEEVSSPLALLKAAPFSATHQDGVIHSITRM